MTKNCYPYLLDPCPIEFRNKPKYDVTIPYERIIYVQGLVNYSMINQLDSLPSVFSITLKNLLPRLTEKSLTFVRVHKAYIINMDYVLSYNKTHITLVGGTIIPIAKRRWKEVYSYLTKQES
ncbi:MAG: LytTR family transcriptional regulator DNA-binding domain-containing protein [Flectobacillus sp.]|uniref:LytTR family transcriptional regulator DNA-binding domain-containing protein n=1 Tax=Flectobacillus sp. TaxID=50419 RepID=UPI003B99D52F